MKKSPIQNLIIKKNQKKATLFLASFGMVIGYFILFISAQLFLDLGKVMDNDKELFQKDFIVINKKISLLNTVKFINTGFSNHEIETVKSQEFVEELGSITANNFKIGAYTDGNSEIPPFYAEMFFESVPDRFLDISSNEWKWDSLSSFIPIVIPRDYLKLYNFGFAQSQNLPQISEEIAGKALADFIIEGSGKKTRLKGRIVGFTDRINSILVPESFMNWANKNYGNEKFIKQPSRLVIVSKDPSDPNLAKFLLDNNYESNTQQTKGSRMNTLLQIVLGIVSFVGVMVILLAFIVFFVSFKLMISRAQIALSRLMLLGFHYLDLAKRYIIIYGVLLASVFILSTIGLVIAKNHIKFLLNEVGFSLTEGLSIEIISLSLTLTLLLFLVNSFSIIKQFKKQAS